MSGELQEVGEVERVILNTEIDQQWADWLAPTRRSLLYGAGAAAVGLVFGSTQVEAEDGKLDFKPIVPAPDKGVSPWGT